MNVRGYDASVFAAVDAAVKVVGRRLNPEDRADLRQDLALKLSNAATPPEDVAKFLCNAARTWVSNLARDSANRLELLKLYHAGCGVSPGYRKGPAWEPRWHKPHESAVALCPFPCVGARVMHVDDDSGAAGNHVEDALIEWLDRKK